MAQKTPGVYVEEISLFPPSVAEVETAIPAFVGYTEKAVKDGADLTNEPTAVRTLLEFEELFGGGYTIPAVGVSLAEQAGTWAVDTVTIANRYYLYDAMRLFFHNGGGKCWIVSCGNYTQAITADAISTGISRLEKYDEPTIILFPDATRLASAPQFHGLQQQTLAQCGKLMDRVGLFDLRDGDLTATVAEFRDGIGINNLKYGAAYTPWVHTAYEQTVPLSAFQGGLTRVGGGALALTDLSSDSDLNSLVNAATTTMTEEAALEARLTAFLGGEPTTTDAYATLRRTLNGTDDAGAGAALTALLQWVRGLAEAELTQWPTAVADGNLRKDINAYATNQLGGTTAQPGWLAQLVALEKNADVLALSDLADEAAVIAAYPNSEASTWLLGLDDDTDDAALDDIAANADDFGDPGAAALATALSIANELDDIADGLTKLIQEVMTAAATHASIAQGALYEGHPVVGNIVKRIKREYSRVPPSGAIAGVYAFVDGVRGVHKAPANVSLSQVAGPAVPIDFFEQEELNVDVTAGKSINAIRSFTGRGTLVWGARTLAGNDNEWRYVPVRRFFNMVEESVKKSTGWAVFEPNAEPLWTKVKSMIDNYLLQKWREGALQGSTPEKAFFVKVGLGETMTPQDVLEGRLIIEIGMAVVRPAEFIILKFSHKLPEA